MEFFQCFLEILLEDGKKAGIASVLEADMSGGQTFNFIACKECHSQHRNIEDWSSLCMPIPDTPVLKQLSLDVFPQDVTLPVHRITFPYSPTSTISELRTHIGSTCGINKDFIVFGFGRPDELRVILDQVKLDTIQGLADQLASAKYAHCRVLAFEVGLDIATSGDKCIRLEESIPVVLKFDKILQSINTFMHQPIRTGSLALLVLPKNADDRDLYKAIANYCKPGLDEEVIRLLNQQHTDNLLPEVKEEEADKSKDKEISVQTKASETTNNSKTESKKPLDKEKPKPAQITNPNDKKKQGSAVYVKNSQTPSPVEQSKDKLIKETPTPVSKNKEVVKEQKSKAEEPSQPTPVPVKKDECTFEDVLQEILLGKLNAKAAMDNKLLVDHPDLRQILASLVDKQQPLSVGYSNQHKEKCLLCSKPGFHECRLMSGRSSHLATLRNALVEGNSDPFQAVPMTVLVHSSNLLKLLAERTVGPEVVIPPIKQSIDLDTCLEIMQKKEDMGKDCLVDCSKCGKKTEREVSYVLEKAPKLFLIQLKRFKTEVDYRTGHIDKKKNTTLVELSEILKVKEQTFELFAVVNHYGEIDKGHYTACVKRKEDGQWFLFDDEKVFPIPWSTVNADCAYLLFYCRTGLV